MGPSETKREFTHLSLERRAYITIWAQRSPNILQKNPGVMPGFFLLLRLFVRSLFLVPLAVLLELDLARDEFLVLATPIVNTLAVLAREFDEIIL